MEKIKTIPVKKTAHSRVEEIDFNSIEFGKYVSDHMLECDFKNGEWQAPQIVPFADILLSPAALALHYGQTVFEGMKAFRTESGAVNIFRIDKHYERFVRSLERICMPPMSEEIFTEGLIQLISLDVAWVPGTEGSALYLRPFVFASEARFGIKVSEEYKFIIFTGPVSLLYSKPVKVKVETHFVRAATGGTGAAKCGGNYGAALLPTKKAKEEGYDQVLWTDSKENKYIEESGMMNVMFVIEGVLVTPPLSDSILDGVTRDSLLTIARGMGIQTEERPVSVDELQRAFKEGKLSEAFGAGTAAVITPIAEIAIGATKIILPVYNEENIMYKLKDQLDDMRYGRSADIYEWNYLL